jgi:hypothetical protein
MTVHGNFMANVHASFMAKAYSQTMQSLASMQTREGAKTRAESHPRALAVLGVINFQLARADFDSLPEAPAPAPDVQHSEAEAPAAASNVLNCSSRLSGTLNQDITVLTTIT